MALDYPVYWLLFAVDASNTVSPTYLVHKLIHVEKTTVSAYHAHASKYQALYDEARQSYPSMTITSMLLERARDDNPLLMGAEGWDERDNLMKRAHDLEHEK